MIRAVTRGVAKFLKVQSRSNHIGIVGTGGVGVSCASSLVHRAGVNKISLFDVNSAVCRGEVMDLEDEAFISNVEVSNASNISDLRDCDIIVITAGGKMNPGEDRPSMLSRSVPVIKSIVDQLLPIKSSAIIIVVSNPVDVMTEVVRALTTGHIPANQVIGSGTYLDSQRLRVSLSKRLSIKSSAIHAYVLGEHGDSQSAPEELIRIGGCTLSDLGVTSAEFDQIALNAKRKAYDITQLKGRTNHGVGECVAAICDSILGNKKHIMAVSTFHPRFGCYLGWPAVLGRGGVESLLPLNLSPPALAKVEQSASVIKSLVSKCTF